MSTENNAFPGPIFIIGSGRSGTTMLRLMLNRHSALRIPRESWFLIPLMEKLPLHGPLDDSQRDLAFSLIRGHSRWKDWECGDDVLRAAIDEDPKASLSKLIDAVFRKCSAMGNARRWGDKTPKYSFVATRLAEIFPEAVFIHMIRDARDVYLSMWSAGWFGRSTRRIASYWKNTTSSALQLRSTCPDRYHEVHYPDLVKSPHAELKRLCQALGEDFEPDMINFYEGAGEETAPWEKALHVKTRRPPSVNDLDRWKKELPLWRVFLVEAVAGDTMKEVGQTPRFGSGWEPIRRFIRAYYQLELKWIDLRIRIENRIRALVAMQK